MLLPRGTAWLACWGMLSIFFVISSALFCGGCGCGREASKTDQEAELAVVYTNRMHDPEYVEALSQNRIQQGLIVAARQKIADQMAALKEAVSASLPPDADEAVLEQALAEHPEWQNLEKAYQAKITEVNQTIEDAKALVRARMLQEKEDVEAVAAQQAVAAPRHNTQERQE